MQHNEPATQKHSGEGRRHTPTDHAVRASNFWTTRRHCSDAGVVPIAQICARQKIEAESYTRQRG